MEQSPSSEANSHSASQEIIPLVPILSQVYPVCNFPHYIPKSHIYLHILCDAAIIKLSLNNAGFS